MKRWLAFWNILYKDMRTYYLKPPNISWGLLMPIAWAGMYLIKSGQGVESINSLLPGIVAFSILFGTTSLLAVTVTFEKKGRSFDRLLLAPISLELLMLAKTSGAILFGTLNAFIPILLAVLFLNVSSFDWVLLIPTMLIVAVSSTFLGLFIAVAVSEVFEAQTFSNFFRFPMVFLCGLFFPIDNLPSIFRPISLALPLTYGVDVLRISMAGRGEFPVLLSLGIMLLFCAA